MTEYTLLKDADGSCSVATVALMAIPQAYDRRVFDAIRAKVNEDFGEVSSSSHPSWCQAAIEGASEALAAAERSERIDIWHRIEITKVAGTRVDTTDDAVRCAAAIATWQDLVPISADEVQPRLDPNSKKWRVQYPSADVGLPEVNSFQFTKQAILVVRLAQHEAQRFNHEYLGTEHLLLGLLKNERNIPAQILMESGITLREGRLKVDELLLPGALQMVTGILPRTPRANRAITAARTEAASMNQSLTGPEHILLGLLHDDFAAAPMLLLSLGIDLKQLRAAVISRCQE